MGIFGEVAKLTPEGKAVQAGGLALQAITGLCAIIFLGVCIGYMMELSKGSKADNKKKGDLQKTSLAFCIMTLVAAGTAYFTQHAMNSL